MGSDRQLFREQRPRVEQMPDVRALEQLPLAGVEVAGVGQRHPVLGNRRTRHRLHQRLLAAADQHRQRHAAEEAAGRCLPGVEVAVGVEPDQHRRDTGSLRTGADRDRRAAVAGHRDRPLAPADRLGHQVGERPLHRRHAGLGLALRQLGPVDALAGAGQGFKLEQGLVEKERVEQIAIGHECTIHTRVHLQGTHENENQRCTGR